MPYKLIAVLPMVILMTACDIRPMSQVNDDKIKEMQKCLSAGMVPVETVDKRYVMCTIGDIEEGVKHE